MSRLKIAVVGVGIGRSHLEAYAALPVLYEIAAVCDLDLDRAREVAEPFGVARLVGDYTTLLKEGGFDVVDLCTPPNTHRPMIEQALAAGCHVVCEKPLVGSLADVDALEDAVEAAGRQLFPIFQYRFGNGLQKLKHLQAKGFARRAFLATIETSWRREADYYAVPWRGKWATELGGCCLTHAIHAHDILSYVLGPVASVSARLKTRVNAVEVEDCAAAAVEMADGSVATLAATLGAAEELSRLRFMFEDMTVESRSPEPYRPGKDPWVFTGKTAEGQVAIDAALADFVPGPESFEGQFARIHAALTGDAPPPVTLDDARASLALITALYHSAETGERVTLPIRSDHPRYRGWVPAARRFG